MAKVWRKLAIKPGIPGTKIYSIPKHGIELMAQHPHAMLEDPATFPSRMIQHEYGWWINFDCDGTDVNGLEY